jgi:outer membrane protein assembly factor BamB
MTLLALVLAAHASLVDAQLPRAPSDVWRVRWSRAQVAPDILDWKAREPGGPAVDALTGVVVVGTRDGVLRARTPDGQALWEFQAEAGFPAPPLVTNGTVYAGSSDGHVYALELGSGKQRWRYTASEEVGTTPVLAGDVLYVATLQDTLVALDAATGTWKWHHRREGTSSTSFTIRGAAGPAVEGGLVFGAFSDGTVASLDAASGAVKWQRKVGPEGQFLDVDSTPVVRDGRVYVAAYSGAVVALDAASGREAWSFRTPGAARVVVAGDSVVAVTTTQVIGLSRAEGQVLWTTPLEGEPAGTPVVLGDRVLVPSVKVLAAYDAKSGKRLLTFDPGTGVSASPAVREKRVYVLSNGGTLVAVDIR